LLVSSDGSELARVPGLARYPRLRRAVYADDRDEEGDAGVKRAVDDPDAVVVVLGSPARQEVQRLFGGAAGFDAVGDDRQAVVSGEGECFAGEFQLADGGVAQLRLSTRSSRSRHGAGSG
jgi:hypothetical protein